MLRFRFWTARIGAIWVEVFLVYVEFGCKVFDDLLVGKLFAPFVPKGGCEGYGISVWETFIEVVVSGFALRKPLALFVGLVYGDLDDSAVCIDGVGVFPQSSPFICIM